MEAKTMFKTKTITLDFKCENRPPTKADFTYKIGPDAIEIADTDEAGSR